MDNDDAPVGRLLSRREALTLVAAASAAMLAGCGPAATGSTQATSAATAAAAEAATGVATPEAATIVATLEAAAPNEEAATALATAESGVAATAETTTAVAAGETTLPSCVVSPELTEGPYFVDEQLNRSDIRTDPASGEVKEGAPLQLTMRVSQISASGCAPLEGAMVDVWHCDALGVYSGVSDNRQGFDTVGQQFLRGYQVTDATGAAQFATIVPGWYSGRAVHIHFKVRTEAGEGQTYEFTSQLFFDETALNQIYAQEPYASKGPADTANSTDGIYQNGGDQLLLALTPAGEGYSSTLAIGLDLSDTTVGAADGGGGPGGAGGPRR